MVTWAVACAGKGRGRVATPDTAAAPVSDERDTSADDTAHDSARPHTGLDSGAPLERVVGAIDSERLDAPAGGLGRGLLVVGDQVWVGAPDGEPSAVYRLEDNALVPWIEGDAEAVGLGRAMAWSSEDTVLLGLWSTESTPGAVVEVPTDSGPGRLSDLAVVWRADADASGLTLAAKGTQVAVGQPRRGAGRVTLLERDGAALSELATIDGITPAGLAGGSVLLDDLDGDGVDELVVGAWGEATMSGAVYVLPGPLEGAMVVDDADRRFTGSDWDVAGFAIAAGDVTGSGLPELIVAAFGDDAAGSGAGAISLVPADQDSVELDILLDRWLGDGADARLGTAVTVADVDADGHADVVAGATGMPGGGAVLLRYGPWEGVGADAWLTSADAESGDAALADLGAAVGASSEWMVGGAPATAAGRGAVLFAGPTLRPPG